MARLAVKVHPRARRNALAGRVEGVWKLELTAPPAGGRANEACIRFFADLAGVPLARVRILRGQTSRSKVIEIEGIAPEELEARLRSC